MSVDNKILRLVCISTAEIVVTVHIYRTVTEIAPVPCMVEVIGVRNSCLRAVDRVAFLGLTGIHHNRIVYICSVHSQPADIVLIASVPFPCLLGHTHVGCGISVHLSPVLREYVMILLSCGFCCGLSGCFRFSADD